ncbi:Lrp/AsnC family transcriptional regulator [Candidatus Micrarchaeota archaeon]|jgi:DNA-binding Lrp family transcriptional regulator|nr:Lrp/AsnC family transcriptional regulator [Candidatus Micrarchaeota archaeon]
MKLNNNDLKLLDLLSQDSRLKIKEAAVKLKTKNATAAYHIAKISDVVVRIPVINFYKVGSVQYHLFIKLKDFENETKNDIEKFAKQFPVVKKITHLTGNFDMLLSLTVYSNSEMAEFYDKLVELFAGKIIFREMTIPYKKWYIAGNMFRTLNPRIWNISPETKIDLNEQERLIINELAQLKRIKELGEKTKLDEKTVRKYMKKLEKTGVILGYSIESDLSRYGYEKYIVRFNVSDKEEIIKNLGKKTGVLSIAMPVSKWDVEAKIIAQSHNDLSKLIKDIKKQVPSLSKYDVLYIEKETIN